MNIGQEIVKELLEGTEKTVAIYGGGFKPPTKGHFEVVKLALEKYPNIDEFIIYVGSGVRDGITQQQSVTIWNIYKTKLSEKVKIITPEVPPVRAVLRYAKDHPDENVIWILGAREDNEEDFTDIANRTKSIENYPNLTVDVITTPGGISGTNARKALNSSKENLFQFLPDEVGQQKNDIYDILTNNQFEERFVPGPLVHESKILKESFTPQKAPLMKRFVEYACNHLDIDEPKIFVINSPLYSQEHKSFGGYMPSEQSIKVVVHNRNMADILRTLAHELVHHMQNLNGMELNGEDGSDTENEANAKAGVIMREFGRNNPEIFESQINEAIVGDRIECDNCGWSWPIADGGDDLFICHKCGHDNIDEYDVENEQDLKEFISFMIEHTIQLNESQITEAEYRGRKVTLGKIMQGDIKKFKVYVKNNKGKVVKVNFGFGGSSAKGKRMVIKAKNPKRRAAYRARHNCDNPGPRWKANYWSCKKW